MTAQDLKNSILQLAMQGKLVEQRVEEGTAKELIAQIEIEKERLIKEGNLKKEKPLSKIAEEEKPFEIPESWEWVRLGNIVSVYGGKRIPAGRKLTEIDTGHKYIRVSDMKNGSVNLEDIKYLEEDIYQKIKAYTISKADIYITVAGTIGQIGTIPVELDNANLTENADKLILYKVNKDFMLYMLSSPMVQMQIKEAITQVGQPKLAIMRIQLLKVPLPPYKEQKRIVAKIEELLPYVEKYDKAYSKLEAFNKKFPEDIKKSILQYAMQGKLVEQRPEEGTGEELYWQVQAEKEKLIKEGKIKKEKVLPKITKIEMGFNIPKTWKWTRLGTVISLLSGTDFKPEEYNDRGIGTVYITGASNLDEDGVIISRWTETPRNVAYQGDVLLVCKGSGYGKTVICDIKEVHIARQIMSIKKMENLDMKFVKYYFDANFAYLKSKGQGVIPGIDRNTVLNMLFPLPPYKEQKRIVAELEKIIPYCKKIAY